MQSQMYVPPLTKINKILIAIYVGVFVLHTFLMMAFNLNLSIILGLSVSAVKAGFIFQILTYPFIDTALLSVVFNSLIMWFIGSELEVKWGRKFYLKFLAISAYSCGLLFLAIGFFTSINLSLLHGFTGINLALLIAYGMIYSERTMIFMFLFPMKAKYFCMLLAAMELFMGISGGGGNSSWAHVISMAVAFLYLKYASLRARGLGVSQIMKNHKNHQAEVKRSKLRLVKDEDQKADPEDPRFWQ